MSTEFDSINGEFHLILKIKGDPSAINLYHRLMRRCDSDWPWKESSGCRICEGCLGIVYRNPRLNPEDIKVGARQAGVHVKVKSYHPESECKDSRGVIPILWLPKEIIYDMVLPGGLDRLRLTLADSRKGSITFTPCTYVPAGTERIPHTPMVDGPMIAAADGSLIQLPADLTDEELAELDTMGGIQ